MYVLHDMAKRDQVMMSESDAQYTKTLIQHVMGDLLQKYPIQWPSVMLNLNPVKYVAPGTNTSEQLRNIWTYPKKIVPPSMRASVPPYQAGKPLVQLVPIVSRCTIIASMSISKLMWCL